MNAARSPGRCPAICSALIAALMLAGTGCGDQHSSSNSGDRGANEKPAESVALIVSGDTAGWIVPCGCTSNQSGGMLRRGTYVLAKRENGPVVYADCGGAPGGTSPYQRLKFESILRGELALEVVAHNLGGAEAALGAEYLRRVASELNVPFVSANLRDAAGKLVAEPARIVTADGLRIALIGVLSPRDPAGGGRIDDPREAVLTTLNDLRGKYDRAIVLAYLPEAELKQLAAAVPEAHAFIGGPTGQSLAPQSVGATLVASATNKGKFIVHLKLPGAARRGALSASVTELSDRFADEPVQVQNVKDLRRQLADRDFSAGETGFAAPVVDPPAEYQVAGSESCVKCHAADHAVWRDSGHARAWETLVAEDAHVDPECQRCHTTGYGLPGGFESVAKSAARLAVGCESCHGPSLAHVEDPKRKTSFVARDECRRCHDPENSPTFEYDSYWKRIVHGERQIENSAESAPR